VTTVRDKWSSTAPHATKVTEAGKKKKKSFVQRL